MALQYNPEDGRGEPERWEPRPGTYRFKIDECSEASFPSGEGVKLVLLVDAGGKYDSKCFENIPLTEKMLWKFRHLCEAVGVSFDPPPETFEFIGKTGVAEFKTEPYNGYVNLKVKDYVVPETVSAAVAKSDDDGDPLPF
jgi:hypothetical protein